MDRIKTEAFNAFMAFGTASIAVAEVRELVDHEHPTGPVADLLVELELAHSRLRDLFADEHDDAVSGLAPEVVLLAERTASALDQARGRPGG